MTGDDNALVERLRRAGFSQSAIDAAWPSWWTEDAGNTASGRAELRFALARRLGLEPKPLLGERVEFVWNDEAKFKHLSAEAEGEKAALTSFGMSVGRILLRATTGAPTENVTALHLRELILRSNPFVDLASLISTCWALGVPLIHLRVFPLESKSMHAMVVHIEGRFAILLCRDASYPAPVAFTLAHELGHIMCGHLADAPALVDLQDPAVVQQEDQQEFEADRFALELLTGSPKLDIQTSLSEYNSPTLAAAALRGAREYAIEPGTLALCLAYQTNKWPIAMSALRFIYKLQEPVWRVVNDIANAQLNWDMLGEESADYLRNVMIGSNV